MAKKKKMEKRKFSLVWILLILAALIAGIYWVLYVPSPPNLEAETAKAACIALCQNALRKGQDLSNGPCLSNEIIEGWVCDVAHKPRQPVDNLPENQCPAYGKTAFHFIEVDPNCNFIRAL